MRRGLFAAWMAVFSILPLLAEDAPAAARAVPMDMYLVVDGSTALKNGRERALQWLCDYAVDGLLREGDRLHIWIAGKTAERIFSETLDEEHTKDSVKTLLRGITLKAVKPDYAGALRDVSGMTAAVGEGRITYTLLISGAGGSSTAGQQLTSLLRYSRAQEFSGFRAIVTDPGIGPMVREAASAYMN